jgi:hypothetical protein
MISELIIILNELLAYKFEQQLIKHYRITIATDLLEPCKQMKKIERGEKND